MSTPNRTETKTGILFLSGAGLDSSIWSHVIDRLDHPHSIAEYPHRKASMASRKHLSLDEYVNHIKLQTEQWGTQKFVIVAHSLGGVIGLQLASELSDQVAGFIAVGAVIPKKGGSFLSALPFPQRIIMPLLLRMAGTKPPESAIRQSLCSDLPAEQAAEIVQNFTPEALRVYTDAVKGNLPTVPSLYVKLAEDKELSPSLQDQMISNLAPDAVKTLSTGHLPMLSDSEGLRRIIEGFVGRVTMGNFNLLP